MLKFQRNLDKSLLFNVVTRKHSTDEPADANDSDKIKRSLSKTKVGRMKLEITVTIACTCTMMHALSVLHSMPALRPNIAPRASA